MPRARYIGAHLPARLPLFGSRCTRPEQAQASAAPHAEVSTAAHTSATHVEALLNAFEHPVGLLLGDPAVLYGLRDGLSPDLVAAGVHGVLHRVQLHAPLLGDLRYALALIVGLGEELVGRQAP